MPDPRRANAREVSQRPWPGITSRDGRPDCGHCSWAYRGYWPFGRMEVKFANAACPVYAHNHVTNVTSD